MRHRVEHLLALQCSISLRLYFEGVPDFILTSRGTVFNAHHREGPKRRLISIDSPNLDEFVAVVNLQFDL